MAENTMRTLTPKDIKIFNKQVAIRKPLYEKILKELAPNMSIALEFNKDDQAWSCHENDKKSTLHIGAGICFEIIDGAGRKPSTAMMRWALDEMFGHEFMHTLVTEGHLSPWGRTYEASIKHGFHNCLEDPYIELFAKFHKTKMSLYQRREARKLMRWSVKLTAPYFKNKFASQYKDEDDFPSFLNFMIGNRTLNYKVNKIYRHKFTNKFYTKYEEENKKYEEMFYSEHLGRNRYKIVDDWFNWIRSTNYFDFSGIDFMDFLIRLLNQIFGERSDKAEGLKQIIEEERSKKEENPNYDPLVDVPIKQEPGYKQTTQGDFENDEDVSDAESSIQESLDALEQQDILDSKLDEELEDITQGREGRVIIYD